MEINWIEEYRQRFKKPFSLASESKPVEFVSTGLIGIDCQVIRRGGLPKGMAVELAGKYSSGKTSIAGAIVAHYQSLGKSVVYFDVEGRLDVDWFRKIGVDLTKLYLPESKGEDVLSEIKYLITKNVDLIVLDSLNFLNATSIIEREDEGVKMNESMGRAKMLNNFARDLLGGFKLDPKDKVISYLRKFDTTLLCLNHLFDAVDGYIKKTETTGGEGMKNAFSVRLFMERMTRRQEESAEGEIVKIKMECKKSSVSPAFGHTSISINQTTGSITDDTDELVACAVAKGLLVQRGAWFYPVGVGGVITDKFNGKSEALGWINEHLEELRS
mgnify:CR=1 FL=1